MSYQAIKGFGSTYQISTPWGSSNISIPIEQIASDAASTAAGSAWKPLRERLYGELPGLVDTVMGRAVPAFELKIPHLMDIAVREAKPDVRKEMDRVIEIATSRAVMVATGLAAVIIGAAWWTRRGMRR